MRLQLQEALADSALTDHLARGLLHLLNAGRKFAPSRLFTGFLRSYATADCLGSSGPLVHGGPCATYLATSAGLQLLCTADGGPSYGMRSMLKDADVLEHWLGRGEGRGDRDALGRLLGGDSSSALEPQLLFGALANAMWYRPLNSRTALDVLLRLGFAAVATVQREDARHDGSGASGSGGGGSGGGGEGGGGGGGGADGCGGGGGGDGGGGGSGGGGNGGGGSRRPALSPGLLPMDAATAALLSVQVLARYRARVWGLPADGARRVAADTQGWRLACAVVCCAVEWADGDMLWSLARVLQLKLDPLPADGGLSVYGIYRARPVLLPGDSVVLDVARHING